MDVFNLKAILSLDSSGFDNGLDKAGATFGKIGGALKTGFSTIAKVGTTAMGAATAGAIALTKASVSGYADYEQLVGGVQKLYGNMGQSLEEYAKSTGKSVAEAKSEWSSLEKAQNMVLDNAKKAYKTAGMSANEYMDIATSFSASLINSLSGDTVKAAEQTDVAMKAISDNFNTFGGDIGMIQSAFQGFAKQNYTMLDNLKLGYGGTKTEMERLIADANEYAASIGEASDLSIESFSDIVTAIDLVQQKQNIAGTTAREASTTIAGSLGMAKSAWENLVTGFADGNADIDQLMGDLIDSVVGYTDEMGNHVNGVIDNILPAIETALVGISQGIAKIAPVIAEKLPELITEVAPPLIDAAWQMVTTLGQALVDNVPTLLNYVDSLMMQVYFALLDFDWSGAASSFADKIGDLFDPEKLGLEQTLLSKAFGIVEAFASGIGEAAPTLVPAAIDLISRFANFIADEIPLMIDSAFDLILGLAEGLTKPESLNKMVDSAIAIITKLAEGLIKNLPKLLQTAPKIVGNLVDALVTNAPKLIVASVKLIFQLQKGIMDSIPSIVEAGIQLVGELVRGIINLEHNLWNAGIEIIESFREGIENFDPAEWGRDLIDSFVRGITSAIGRVREAVSNVANTVRSYLHFSEPDVGPLADFSTYAPDMMKLFAKGIEDNENVVSSQINKSFDFGNDIVSSIPSSSSSDLSQIIGLLNNFLPQIANMQMVTDTGVLVGALAPAMNTQLGSIRMRNDKR
jgi:phage-related protein